MDSSNILQVVVGIISDSSHHILMTQRALSLHQGGLWEFPGGKVEPGETFETALKRELCEEIDIEIQDHQFLMSLIHQYTDKSVQLHVYLITQYSGIPKICDGQLNMKWVDLLTWNNLDTPVPISNLKIIAYLQSL